MADVQIRVTASLDLSDQHALFRPPQDGDIESTATHAELRKLLVTHFNTKWKRGEVIWM